MPQKELKYLSPTQDGRRKIHANQYEEIKQLYAQLKSFQKVADHYQVSKRLIIFIINPQSLIKLKEHNRKIEHWKKYYNTEKRKEYMRSYRLKKRQLGFLTSQKIKSATT